MRQIDEVVKKFYTSMDVSYTAPGMKDEITVWEGGVKKHMRKYYLTMYIQEANALFLERHPDMPISFSAFAKLHPPNVLLLKDSPGDQCKCQMHENFRLQLIALGIQYSYHSWWGQVLCDSGDLLGKCSS